MFHASFLIALTNNNFQVRITAERQARLLWRTKWNMKSTNSDITGPFVNTFQLLQYFQVQFFFTIVNIKLKKIKRRFFLVQKCFNLALSSWQNVKIPYWTLCSLEKLSSNLNSRIWTFNTTRFLSVSFTIFPFRFVSTLKKSPITETPPLKWCTEYALIEDSFTSAINRRIKTVVVAP